MAKVLILEQSKSMRNILRERLEFEGFATTVEEVLASIRVYREGRHGSQRWANLAAFSEATDLFQIQKPADFELSRAYLLESGGERFEILDIERIKGHDLYLQIIAKCITGAVS